MEVKSNFAYETLKQIVKELKQKQNIRKRMNKTLLFNNQIRIWITHIIDPR